MKITDIQHLRGLHITTDHPEHPDYIRFGATNWLVRYGESWEPLYDDEELEEAYQKTDLSTLLKLWETWD